MPKSNDVEVLLFTDGLMRATFGRSDFTESVLPWLLLQNHELPLEELELDDPLDEDELDDYRQAMTHHEQIRGLEIITNDITRQVFPIALDIDHPAFRAGLSHLVTIAEAFDQAKAKKGLWARVQQGWHGARAAVQFARLFVLPVKSQTLNAKTILRPTW